MSLFFFFLSAAYAASPCSVSCKPGQLQDISVLVVPKSENTEMSKPGAEAFHEVAPGSRDESPLVVSTIGELATEMQRLANQCKRIKRLDIYGHGSPGTMALGSDDEPSTFDIVSLLYELKGMDCAMAAGAEIHFAGCNTGKGCRGENFMMAVARTLLNKGGAVHAAPAIVNSLKYTPVAPRAIGGNQVLMVDAELKNPRWAKPPVTYGECLQHMYDDLASLERLRPQLAGCMRDNLDPRHAVQRSLATQGMENLDRSQALLRNMIQKYLGVCKSRESCDRTKYGLQPDGFFTSVDLAGAYNVASDTLSQFKHVGPCITCEGNCHIPNGESCFFEKRGYPLKPLPESIIRSWIDHAK